MDGAEWRDPEFADRYLERDGGFPHLAEGDDVLRDQIPRDATRVLDLGTGDGRLLRLLRADGREFEAVGLDGSRHMLDTARERIGDAFAVELVHHDLAQPLPDLGTFEAIVSSFAIHHLEHERKAALYAEAFGLLAPGGVFANLEHVASPTQRLHEAFFAAIDEPLECEDPSDRTIDVESQLEWLRDAGFTDVDCYWKWLEMALLIGVKP